MMRGAPRFRGSTTDAHHTKKNEPIIVRHFNPNLIKRNCTTEPPNFPQVMYNGGYQANPVFKLVDSMLSSTAKSSVSKSKCVRRKSSISTSKSKTGGSLFTGAPYGGQTRTVRRSGPTHATTIVSKVGGGVTSRSYNNSSACLKKSSQNSINKKPFIPPAVPRNGVCSNIKCPTLYNGCTRVSPWRETKIKTNLNNIGSNTNLRVSLHTPECGNLGHSPAVSVNDCLQFPAALVKPQPQPCLCPTSYIQKLKQEIGLNKSQIAEDARNIINELKQEILNYRHIVKPTYSSSCTDVVKATPTDVSTVTQLHHYTLDLFDQVRMDSELEKDAPIIGDSPANPTGDMKKCVCNEKQMDFEPERLVPQDLETAKSISQPVSARSSARVRKSTSRKSDIRFQEFVGVDLEGTVSRQKSDGGKNVITIWRADRSSACSSTATERTESSSAPADLNLDFKLEEANSLIEKVKMALNDIGRAIPQKEHRSSRESTPEKAVKNCRDKFEKVLRSMEEVLHQSIELKHNTDKITPTKPKCNCLGDKTPEPDLPPQEDSKSDTTEEVSSESGTMQVLQEKLGAISELSAETEEQNSSEGVHGRGDKSSSGQNIDSGRQCAVAKEEKARIEQSGGDMPSKICNCGGDSKCECEFKSATSEECHNCECDYEDNSLPDMPDAKQLSYDDIPCKEPKEDAPKPAACSTKKLSIQVMPCINVGRCLALQRTLNLTIKPSGDTENDVFAQPNMAYTELMDPSEADQDSQGSQNFSDGESELMRRTTRQYFDMSNSPVVAPHTFSSEEDNTKYLILKSFQVVENDSDKQHPIQMSVSERPSREPSETVAGSVMSGGNNQTMAARAPQFDAMQLRSPWDFGFYLSKATQCDETYFAEERQQPVGNFKYAKGMYMPAQDLTIIPEKDVTTISLTTRGSDGDGTTVGSEGSSDTGDDETSVTDTQEAEEPVAKSRSDQGETSKSSSSVLSQTTKYSQKTGSRTGLADEEMIDANMQVSVESYSDSEESLEDEEDEEEEEEEDNGDDVEKPDEDLDYGFEGKAPQADNETMNTSVSMVTEVMTDDLATKGSLDTPKKHRDSEESSSSDSQDFYKGTKKHTSRDEFPTFLVELTGTKEQDISTRSRSIHKSLSGRLRITDDKRPSLDSREEDKEEELKSEPLSPSGMGLSDPRKAEKPEDMEQLRESLVSVESEDSRELPRYRGSQEIDGPEKGGDKDKTVMMLHHIQLDKKKKPAKPGKQEIQADVLPLYKKVFNKLTDKKHSHARKFSHHHHRDPVPAEESISEGEISCKHSLSNGELHLCKFADGVLQRVKQGQNDKSKSKLTKISQQRLQYNNWLQGYLQKSNNSSIFDSSSSNSSKYSSRIKK